MDSANRGKRKSIAIAPPKHRSHTALSGSSDRPLVMPEKEDSDKASYSDILNPIFGFNPNAIVPIPSVKEEIETDPSSLQSRLSKSYAMAAEQVKLTLITNLVSSDHGSDAQFMSALAETAFRSLNLLHAEYDDLYGLVRTLISFHTLLGEALREIKKNGCSKDLMIRRDSLIARCLGAKKALESSKTSLAEAIAEVVGAQRLLKEAEANLVRGTQKVELLELNVEKLGESYEALKSDEENLRKRVEIVVESERSRDENIAAIERIKVGLSARIDRLV